LLPSAKICGNANIPLSVIIKPDTAPCHFVSTSYTDNLLEYSVVKILNTNNSVLTNKTHSGKKPLTVTWDGNGLLLGVSGVNCNIPNPGSYGK
jgi:hypothetical protein